VESSTPPFKSVRIETPGRVLEGDPLLWHQQVLHHVLGYGALAMSRIPIEVHSSARHGAATAARRRRSGCRRRIRRKATSRRGLATTIRRARATRSSPADVLRRRSPRSRRCRG
jgi:hypothetical protein